MMNNACVYEDSKLGEKLCEYTHKSGLTVQVIPRKGTFKKFAIMSVAYGAINTSFILPGKQNITKVPQGVAHFLEHKLFEQPNGNMLDFFASQGARTNAATGFAKTYYYFSCTENFDQCFDMLLHFVTHPHLTDENVEKEKGIICREIKMYEDNPEYVASMNMLKVMYHNHPVKNEIAGSVESVIGTTREDLQLCYDSFYIPKNMVLTVCGDFNPDEIYNTVCKTMDGTEAKELPAKYFEIEPKEVLGHRITQSMDVSRPLFVIGFKDSTDGFNTDEYLTHSLAGSVLNGILFDKSSDFFEKMYNKGLIDYTFASDFDTDRYYANASVSGESDNPEELLKYLQEYISEMSVKGICEESFTRIKRAQFGSDIRMFTFPDSIGKLFSSLYLQGIHGFDYFNAYGKITVQDAERILRRVYMQEPVLSVIKPM